tara:strand:- start:737 stop:928 length:192 start_codon:yes stop_codon:yes gene_type:complete
MTRLNLVSVAAFKFRDFHFNSLMSSVGTILFPGRFKKALEAGAVLPAVAMVGLGLSPDGEEQL